ncbi:MAG: PAS domain-containing protein [Labilithrix sp.]|nr:PAS domain-containing protein [Labilithrix sp.]MCW5815398.1 PAS domain-containing protein [Labilithrix sp.]
MVADSVSALVGRAMAGLPDSLIVVEGTPSDGVSRKILFVNEAFTRMTGFTAAEAIGRTPDITVGPETSVEALQAIQRARDALEPLRVELLKYRKDGSTFWVEMDLVPLFDDESRKLLHYLAVMRDVTARRAEQLRKMENERLAAIGTLAAGVAHEMNNPLAYALMNIGYVEEELDELIAATHDPTLPRWSELRSTLTEVRDGVSRVAQIVRDIRAFSQLDAMPSGRCNIPVLVERAVQMSRSGMPASAQISTHYDETSEVVADPGRLAQVFLNLIVNALDAIPPEENDKRRVFVRAFNDDNEVIVEVTDEGRGIPDDVMPRIFDPFFTTKEAGKGTGLGLSISYGIVRAAGGTMTVKSRVGVGTTVRIALPSAGGARARSVLRPRAVETVPPASGLRLRVLVVDDEPMICRALKRALSPAEDVTTVGSALEAIALFEDGREFDLVLCDLSMPGMSGAGLYEQVGSRWPALQPRVVIMTGGASTEATRDFLARSQVPRLDKPLDMRRLRAILDEHRSSSAQQISQTR